LAWCRDGLGARGPDPGDRFPVGARFVDVNEGEGGRAVRGIVAERSLVPGPRAIGVPELLLEDPPDPMAEGGAGVGVVGLIDQAGEVLGLSSVATGRAMQARE